MTTKTTKTIETYYCETCHAQPGHRCTRPAGIRTAPHAARVRRAERYEARARYEGNE